jgi:hypothetical protein
VKKLIFLLFLTCCSSNDLNKNIVNFDKNLTYDEFKELLVKYSKVSEYPDIGN